MGVKFKALVAALATVAQAATDKFMVLRSDGSVALVPNPIKSQDFTPVAKGTTSVGVGTYAQQTGHLTKIHDRVFFNLVIRWTAHTGTGDLKITMQGNPYPSKAGTNDYSTLNVYYSGLTVGAGKQLSAYVYNDSVDIILAACDPAGGASTTVPVDSSVTFLIISGSYLVETP